MDELTKEDLNNILVAFAVVDYRAGLTADQESTYLKVSKMREL